jgi:hypothetical protein
VNRFYAIQQVTDHDCGPTALKSLLAYLFHNENFLFLQENWIRPTTFKHLLEYASHFGVTLKGYKLHHPSSVRGLTKPFLALMKNPNSHYVLVIPRQHHCFELIDPSGTQTIITDQYFDQTFTGYILLVKHIKSDTKASIPMIRLFFQGFFIISFIVFFTLLVIWFHPSTIPRWIIPSIGGIVGITWSIYVYTRMRFLDSLMIKHYLHLIQHRVQFVRFHQWKQGWLLFPLRQFYRWMVVTLVISYVSYASITFLIPLTVLHAMTQLWLPFGERAHQEQLASLQNKEESLRYPRVTLNDMNLIGSQVFQLLHLHLQRWIVFGLSMLFIILIYGYFFPYQDFLSWITMMTLMIVTLQQHQGWIRRPYEKSAWRQQGFLFLNNKDYDKIKS